MVPELLQTQTRGQAFPLLTLDALQYPKPHSSSTKSSPMAQPMQAKSSPMAQPFLIEQFLPMPPTYPLESMRVTPGSPHLH